MLEARGLQGAILTAAEMRAEEAALFASGIASFALMQRAGNAAATRLRADHPMVRSIAVCCGPGNNGGDGYVMAATLRAHLERVDVFATTAPKTADAQRAAGLWGGPVRAVCDLATQHYDVVVDALFGIGLTRDLDSDAAHVVAAIQAAGRQGARLVALDIASGLDADTGAERGVTVAACETITFHTLKPAHVLEPGRRLSGRVSLVDIGLPRSLGARVTCNTSELWAATLPRLDVDAHKYTRGHTLVFAGGIEGVGAARLAARAALRVGAGLVTLAVPRDALIAHASRGPDALMVRAVDNDDVEPVLEDKRRNVVVIGPAYGVGPRTRAIVARLLGERRAAVLDADALTAFAGDSASLAAALWGNASVVVTPHAGEFARLLPSLTGSKIVRTREAARCLGAVVVHKGPDTVVAHPDGRCAVNVNGSVHLATAGSGDVLAGMIAGAMAQGMPAFEAACAAVFCHAATGARLGAGLIADDLADAVRLAAT